VTFGPPARDRWDNLQRAIDAVTVPGFWAEFGVWKGESLRFIAARTQERVVGFDSFSGLSVKWNGMDAGAFATDPPTDLPDNAEVVTGWFEHTLPEWLRPHDRPAAFVHVDCDLYASACAVLGPLRPRLVTGTVLVFDEYQNYPGWEDHEFRAWREIEVPYDYIGYNPNGEQVTVRVR
jgi:hypothetical protein